VIHIVGGVLLQGGRILLGRRVPTKRVCPEMWDVPGGHCEDGESFEHTLARELAEEIGVTPTGMALLGTVSFMDEGRPVALHIYRVDAWAGEPMLMNDEHTELRWFSIEEAAALPDLAAPEYVALFRTLDGA
jgi:mutator protein MutT